MEREIHHTHIVGRTRMGKSYAIEDWFLRAVMRGTSAILIDPHGDLFDHLVCRLALMASFYPALCERVVIVNPIDPDWSVGLNPLELFAGEVAERKASFLVDVLTTIYHDDPSIVVRMQRVMFNAFVSLMELGGTLDQLPRFLTDKALRDWLLPGVQNRSVRNFWRFEFPSDKREAEVWRSSTLHRLEPLIADPDVRLMFCQPKSTINFRAIMDTGKVLLVKVAKGQLTERTSILLGAFYVAQVQQTAMTRVDVPEEERPECHLFVDEAHNFVTASARTLLEESGKYWVRFTLAHQHMAQVRDDDLRAAILSQCAHRVCFGVGKDDARVLAPEIFLPDLDQVKELPADGQASGRVVFRSLPETWELLERNLTELPARYFWHKSGTGAPVLCYSNDMPSVDVSPALIRRLVEASGSLYALPKAQARELIETRNSDFTHILSSASMSATRHGTDTSSKPVVITD